MIKINKLDRKIIAELDMDARMPISRLAKAVRSSREVIAYRIKALTKKGVISGTQAFFNPYKTGHTLYRVLIRLDSSDGGVIRKFQEYFAGHNHVMWFAELGGRWDYVIEFFAKNADEFNEILEKAIERFKEYIKLYEISTILEIHCYKRRYIYDNKKEISFLVGGKVQNLRIDDIDKKIISELKSNAQLSNTQIAQKLGLARNTIKYRIEKLAEKGIILGYKLFYRPQALGFQSYKLFISMKNLYSGKEKEFFAFSQNSPNITFAHKNLGKWNYELEIEVKDIAELQKIIVDLRVRFKDFIIDYDMFPILHDHKIDLFPSDIL